MGALEGKKAVITGGGQGIGLGISRAFVDAGADVLVAQRKPLPAELAGCGWLEADLAEPQSYAAVAAAAGERWQHVDILVNNAGIMFEKPLDEMQLEDWNRMLAVNLTAPVFLARELLPLLRPGGNIINTGSIEGLAANPGHIAYCATKGGVHALTRAMAVDLGSDSIRVNAIAPGWIRSELSDNYIDAQADSEAAREGLYRMHPAGRVGEPGDVGQLAVFLAGDNSAFVTGQVIVIDGGRTSKLPLPF
ncbi:MAG: SDR family oxidoreductase [Gammaproteobacteria bacterium]|jgi:meso-butanediol dehydrogenase/(S,S)-butanediol dehydrogenase/diacetyl reductase